MITANGKNIIRRFHARDVAQIAGAMAFGVGSTPESGSDAKLQYEVVRASIISVNVDPDTGQLVFRSSLQPGRIKTIYEVGLWSSTQVGLEGYNLNLLSTNSPVLWTNGELTNTHARANENTLQVTFAASGTTTAELNGFANDLSSFSDFDSVAVAYHATVNLSSLRVRLGQDSSNYFEWLLPSGTDNSYNIARMTRGAATKTGNPVWDNITYAAVRPSGTAAGGGNVFFDGIRFEYNSLIDTNILVARSVLTTPASPDTEISIDVEYAIGVDVT